MGFSSQCLYRMFETDYHPLLVYLLPARQKDRAFMTSKPDLQSIDFLEPISQSDFFQNYWDKQPLHISRSTGNPFELMLSISDVEDILSTNTLLFPNVQLTNLGKHVPQNDFCDENSQVTASKVVEYFESGATIILSHAQKLHKPLASLCRQVQTAFSMSAQTNVYLSPAGQQGFNPHYDSHDVFILQVAGSKVFNFYENQASFPTVETRFNKDVFAVGKMTQSVQLNAGDTLYIPNSDDLSLHITLGVYPVLLHTLVSESMRTALHNDARLRHAVLSNCTNSDLVEKIICIIKDNITEQNVEFILSELRDEMALSAQSDIQGELQNKTKVHLGANENTETIHAQSRIEINRDAIISVEQQGVYLKIRTVGRILELEEPFALAAKWLLSNQHDARKTCVNEIPGVNESQRLSLCQRLIAAKVITTV